MGGSGLRVGSSSGRALGRLLITRHFVNRAKKISISSISCVTNEREKRLYYMWTHHATVLGGQKRKIH